jgi:hypothetical protein
MVQRQRTRTVRVPAMTFPAAAIGSHHRRRSVFGVLVVAYLVRTYLILVTMRRCGLGFCV